MTVGELSNALSDQSYIDSPLTTLPSNKQPQSPWFLQLLIGFSAWVASIFLLLFFFLLLYQVYWVFLSGALLIGLFSTALAMGIFRSRSGRESSATSARDIFLPQFALALSLAGQAAFSFGFSGLGGASLCYLAMLALELLLIAAISHPLHRFLSVVLATSFWSLVMRHWLLGDIVRFGTTGSAPTAISLLVWLLVFIPLAIAAYWLVRNESRQIAAPRAPLDDGLRGGLIAALSITPLTQVPLVFFVSDSDNSWLAAWSILAALMSCFSGALAYYRQHRPLLGLAILMALCDLGAFYFALSVSLMTKAALMVLLGIAFLLAAQYLQRRKPA
jgi:hypothetical protein